MRFVKVQYDAYNRQFKVANPELSTELDDGALYLVADFSEQDFLPAADLDLLEADHTPA